MTTAKKSSNKIKLSIFDNELKINRGIESLGYSSPKRPKNITTTNSIQGEENDGP